jgi:putative NADPH-quinone reductase
METISKMKESTSAKPAKPAKKIFILLGHPDKETKCGSFADAYEKGARDAGFDVRRINLGDLKFDPILHKGYKEIQALEPDLLTVQEAFRWADHIALFYPNWFITMPALLKGLFDRIWLPGFAYHFKKNGYGWTGLFKGKSADVFITMDAMPIAERVLFGDYSNEIRRGVLRFSGIRPVKITKIGPMHNVSDGVKAKWRERAYKWGRMGK